MKANAILENSHFVYTSGMHSSVYLNKDALYADPRVISELCGELARRVHHRDIDVVVGPAIGGTIVSTWTAYHLSVMRGDVVHSVYAEKEHGELEIRRGYPAFVKNKRVLVVEDILNTGGSALDTVDAVRNIGGDVVMVGALCNRGGATAQDLAVPYLEVLLDYPAKAYSADVCPLCAANVPINNHVGHGVKFRTSA